MPKTITREIKMFDVEENQNIKSINTIIYQYVQEEVGDEFQQGGGNVLGTSGTIATKGRVKKDDDDDV